MKAVVNAQHEEVIQALSGRGCYRVAENYQSLSVSLEEWTKMRPDQRKSVVKSFFTAELRFSTLSESATENLVSFSGVQNSTSSTSSLTLSISPEDSGFHTIPISILQAIWSKAAALINDDNSLTLISGTDTQAHAVKSYRSSTPHIVRLK